jgi:hypothetical protein
VLDFLRTTRGRVGLALLTSLVIVALALVPFREALPILPVLLLPVWVYVFTPKEPVSPPAKRLMLVLTGVLAVFAGLGVFAFVLVQT